MRKNKDDSVNENKKEENIKKSEEELKQSIEAKGKIINDENVNNLDSFEEESEVEEILEENSKEEVKEEIMEKVEEWIPCTKLGRLVKEGKISLDDILSKGYVIREPEITDFLLPDLEEKVLYVGGTTGKGGGIQRRAIRRTVRIHKSGKRMNLSAMVAVGNKNGYLGIGFGKAKSNKEALKKAALNARKNIFFIKRGCGSWECKCGKTHSIPLEAFGKTGSVNVKLMPAPKGLGLCASDEIKKLFELVGIQDIRIKTRGQTGTRMNFIYAVGDALRNLGKYKLHAVQTK